MGSHALRASADATAVMMALRRIVRVLRIADRDAEGSLGVSAAQLYVLRTLADAPARSVAELAGRTFTDQSSVSTVVARLVARKLVARTRAATDRRRAELRLTAAGERIVRAAPGTPQRLIADVVHSWSAERRDQLVRSLEGLVEAIGADEVAPRMLFEDEARRSRRHAGR